MSEINMTPFVDVILVLLIIFLVTLPLVQHNIGIELPTIKSQKLINPSKKIEILISQERKYRLNNKEIDLENLQDQIIRESQQEPKPVALLYVDKNSRYEDIAKILAMLSHSGIGKIGFITSGTD